MIDIEAILKRAEAALSRAHEIIGAWLPESWGHNGACIVSDDPADVCTACGAVPVARQCVDELCAEVARLRLALTEIAAHGDAWTARKAKEALGYPV